MGRGVAIAILMIFLITSIIGIAAAKPSWVDVGKYAEYEILVDSNIPNVPSGKIGSVKLQVKTATSDSASIEISTSIDQQVLRDMQNALGIDISMLIPIITTSYTWNYTNDVYLFILGSESLDKLSKGQSLPGVSLSTESKMVPAGTFNCYKFSYSYNLFGVMMSINMWFEKSSGLLVAYEYDVQYSGQKAHLSMQLKSTNIVGGASILILIIIGVAIAIVIGVGLLIARRYSRKTEFITQPQPSQPQLSPLQ